MTVNCSDIIEIVIRGKVHQNEGKCEHGSVFLSFMSFAEYELVYFGRKSGSRRARKFIQRGIQEQDSNQRLR